MTHFNRWFLGASAILVSAATAITATTASSTTEHCFQVHGHLSLTPREPWTCPSPIGVCAVGELRGALTADSSFTGTSFVPTVDTATTGVALLTGDNVIATTRGVLYTKDAIVLRTVGAGEFAELDTIVGGTGVFDGATGIITAYGTYDAATGGEGTYFGRICVE